MPSISKIFCMFATSDFINRSEFSTKHTDYVVNNTGNLSVSFRSTIGESDNLGEVTSFLLHLIYFLQMSDSVKDRNNVNNSTVVSTSAHDTCKSHRYTVSEETSKYLDCLAALDKVFTLYFDAVEFQYCEAVADETIKKIFYDKFKALRNDIESSMTECIYDQMSCIDNNSI